MDRRVLSGYSSWSRSQRHSYRTGKMHLDLISPHGCLRLTMTSTVPYPTRLISQKLYTTISASLFSRILKDWTGRHVSSTSTAKKPPQRPSSPYLLLVGTCWYHIRAWVLSLWHKKRGQWDRFRLTLYRAPSIWLSVYWLRVLFSCDKMQKYNSEHRLKNKCGGCQSKKRRSCSRRSYEVSVETLR